MFTKRETVQLPKRFLWQPGCLILTSLLSQDMANMSVLARMELWQGPRKLLVRRLFCQKVFLSCFDVFWGQIHNQGDQCDNLRWPSFRQLLSLVFVHIWIKALYGWDQCLDSNNSIARKRVYLNCHSGPPDCGSVLDTTLYVNDPRCSRAMGTSIPRRTAGLAGCK
jgi:hypothetical protein